MDALNGVRLQSTNWVVYKNFWRGLPIQEERSQCIMFFQGGTFYNNCIVRNSQLSPGPVRAAVLDADHMQNAICNNQDYGLTVTQLSPLLDRYHCDTV